ncbi:S8 family serine peptidase [Marinilongibacter aquaticus]|uniref:S8 family peptidase n=1 Tax=Marinilongibacter aquaticus TaxID=2975157 RepID=UPI0021BDD0FF|nr:S8 family serine peptidase [Marinilongibacter aquaticus]UBM59653.1 S8 family serine peptidase [Marinilongibacter aquaticus]
MKEKLGIMLLLYGSCCCSLQAQNKYLVYFRDKAASPYASASAQDFLSAKAIARRQLQGIAVNESDYPPNPNYIQDVHNAGAKVLHSSRWFNAVLISCTEQVLASVLALEEVSHIWHNAPLNRSNSHVKKARKPKQISELDYGDANTQISFLGVDEMHNRGFHGENMWIAILDDGFLNANSIACLDSVFTHNQILEIYDFVDEDSTVFANGGHGTSVFSCHAANQPGQIVSPATKAHYALFRTEDGTSETPLEEVNWLIAAEHADSLGIDILSTSLGYSEFDEPEDNYTYTDMDGNTALITRAADMAASKGMLVVNSAGNEGSSAWHYITAPADGDSVLAIGAVNRYGELASFSSRGPSSDNRTKPDLMAVGEATALCSPYDFVGTANGTSFSAPLVAAMAAGFWQANRYLTAFEVMDCLRKSGNQYANPDNNYGFGMANFVRADSVAKSEYGINPLQKKGIVDSYCIERIPACRILFNFRPEAVGKKLRITFVDQDLKQTLQQDSFVLLGTQIQENLAFDTLKPHIIMRIENISDTQTELIVRF